jgi:hypothetical protein
MGYFASASTSACYAVNEKQRAVSVPDNKLLNKTLNSFTKKNFISRDSQTYKFFLLIFSAVVCEDNNHGGVGYLADYVYRPTTEVHEPNDEQMPNAVAFVFRCFKR